MEKSATDQAPDNTELAEAEEATQAVGGQQSAPEGKEKAEGAAAAEAKAEPVETLGVTEEDEGGAESATARPKDQPSKVPEKYADFKVPEGLQVDEAFIAQFHEKARASNMTQEQAQEWFTYGIETYQKMFDEIAAKREELNAQWLEEAKRDREIGGDKLTESVKCAKAYLSDTLGKDGATEFRKLLSSYGLANHPVLLKLLVRGFKASAEDVSPRGQAGADQGDPLSVLYPSLSAD